MLHIALKFANKVDILLETWPSLTVKQVRIEPWIHAKEITMPLLSKSTVKKRFPSLFFGSKLKRKNRSKTTKAGRSALILIHECFSRAKNLKTTIGLVIRCATLARQIARPRHWAPSDHCNLEWVATRAQHFERTYAKRWLQWTVTKHSKRDMVSLGSHAQSAKNCKKHRAKSTKTVPTAFLQ